MKRLAVIGFLLLALVTVQPALAGRELYRTSHGPGTLRASVYIAQTGRYTFDLSTGGGCEALLYVEGRLRTHMFPSQLASISWIRLNRGTRRFRVDSGCAFTISVS